MTQHKRYQPDTHRTDVLLPRDLIMAIRSQLRYGETVTRAVREGLELWLRQRAQEVRT